MVGKAPCVFFLFLPSYILFPNPIPMYAQLCRFGVPSEPPRRTGRARTIGDWMPCTETPPQSIQAPKPTTTVVIPNGAVLMLACWETMWMCMHRVDRINRRCHDIILFVWKNAGSPLPFIYTGQLGERGSRRSPCHRSVSYGVNRYFHDLNASSRTSRCHRFSAGDCPATLLSLLPFRLLSLDPPGVRWRRE